MFLLFMLLAWITGSCALVDEDLSDVGDHTQTLAMSVKNIESGQVMPTKMSADVTQVNAGSFRGIEEIIVIPFSTEWSKDKAKPVEAQTPYFVSRNVAITNPYIRSNQLIEYNHARLFDNATLPNGMNRVLTYGKASESSDGTKDSKHIYGVLTPIGMDLLETAGDIRFKLEPILTENEPNEINQTVDEILTKLTFLISTLQKSTDETVRGIYNQLKLASEDKILACSTPVLNNIRDDLAALYSVPHAPDDPEFNAIYDAYTSFAQAIVDYFPNSYGIPDGAIGFWWNGDKFERLINGVNIALIDSENYCYPPSLWYYGNSTILTTEDDARSWYVSANDWDTIRNKYKETIPEEDNGEIVRPSTKSVAIYDPLQYGVGMLELSIKALDPVEDAIIINRAGGCPLTGIIIGGQREVDFAFRPLTSDAHYTYDNKVLTANNKNLEIGVNKGSVQTLVLQTPDDSPVHFALEFKNTTGKSIPCQQGNILPNCMFYLAGELVPSDEITGYSDEMKSVFKQDRKTYVSVKIKSLNKAYNTVPDLRDPQLEIGISAEMKWTQIQPFEISIKL